VRGKSQNTAKIAKLIRENIEKPSGIARFHTLDMVFPPWGMAWTALLKPGSGSGFRVRFEYRSCPDARIRVRAFTDCL
jgi:hypothetical protein